jgi:uncharacterized protein DUF1844
MNDEQTTFKVTDRRLFNPDGTPRDLAPEEKPEPKPTSVTADATAASPPAADSQAGGSTAAGTTQEESLGKSDAAAESEENDLPTDDPASFVNFIMSIASNAASALGMMEHPVTRQREVDLELAKHWIDILGMLQQKTRGNLSLQEEKIVEGLLADLRMQYVSMAGSGPPKASRTYSGRDITGGR